VQTGNAEAKILEHIENCDTVLKLLSSADPGYFKEVQYIAMMQAKSTALVALSNMKAVRINKPY
jgi:hypothetical protein